MRMIFAIGLTLIIAVFTCPAFAAEKKGPQEPLAEVAVTKTASKTADSKADSDDGDRRAKKNEQVSADNCPLKLFFFGALSGKNARR